MSSRNVSYSSKRSMMIGGKTRVVYTGLKGGRYYIKSGGKVYVKGGQNPQCPNLSSLSSYIPELDIMEIRILKSLLMGSSIKTRADIVLVINAIDKHLKSKGYVSTNEINFSGFNLNKKITNNKNKFNFGQSLGLPVSLKNNPHKKTYNSMGWDPDWYTEEKRTNLVKKYNFFIKNKKVIKNKNASLTSWGFNTPFKLNRGINQVNNQMNEY